jgi:hypothetical protein
MKKISQYQIEMYREIYTQYAEYLGSPPGFDGIRTVMTVRGTEYLGSPPGL